MCEAWVFPGVVMSRELVCPMGVHVQVVGMFKVGYV